MIKSILWLIVLAAIVYILFDITVFVYRKWTGKSKEQAQKDIYNFFNSQNTYLIRNDMVFNDKMWNIVKSVIGDERFSRLKEIAEELWLRAYDETSGIPCLRYSMDIDEEEKNIIKERMKKRLQSTLELHNFPTKVMAEWNFNEEADKQLYRLIKEPSVIRYENDYRRFIYGTDFGNTEVANVTEEMLEKFIISAIFDNNLTAKAFSGLRTILIGMFKYAKKRKYTTISVTNFFGDLELSPNMFRHVVKNDEDEVFTDFEVRQISNYVKEHPTIRNLGVLLAFHTGLRVGELTALTPDDIDWENHILLINKTEIKIKDKETGKYTYAVSDQGKTENSTRNVVFTASAEWVLHQILKINPHGTYLFENPEGKRIRGTTMNKRLHGICRALGIKERSIHKSRKSYATQLLDAGVGDALIISQLGHSDILTTRKHYYRNSHTLAETRNKLESALALG